MPRVMVTNLVKNVATKVVGASLDFSQNEVVSVMNLNPNGMNPNQSKKVSLKVLFKKSLRTWPTSQFNLMKDSLQKVSSFKSSL